MTPNDKLDQLLDLGQALRVALLRRTLVIGVSMMALFYIAIGNRHNGNLLVECTTPGPKPPPTTGNHCWDRLHAPDGTNNAIAIIVDDIYCDHRRAQAKLPPVPDPTKLCRDQTPPEVLAGPPR